MFLVVFLRGGQLPDLLRQGFFTTREASLRLFFALPALAVRLFAPAIAMRMWAEERRSGTIELLLTLPVTIAQAVLGKFLAGWVFFGIALLADLPDGVHGERTSASRTTAPIFSGYLGAFLMAGAYLAIGGVLLGADARTR